MTIENWFDAAKELPDHSGEYVIKRKNMEPESVFYLKKGEPILLKGGVPDPSRPENRLLFALSKHLVQVKIPEDGFYLCREDKEGREILSKIPVKGTLWSSRKNKTLGYSKRRKSLMDHKKEESLSNKRVSEKIDEYIKEEAKFLFVYKELQKTFSEDTYDFCGVTYEVNPLTVKKSFYKALKYRDVIKDLRNYKNIDKLKGLLENTKIDHRYPIDEALKLRDDFCKYLESKGLFTEDIETISDAYFINLFLPTKKDIIKVLYRDEARGGYISREIFLVKVFHRYEIIDAIRRLGQIYQGKDVPADGLLDNISVINLAESFAMSRFKIAKFKDDFKKEMGLA